jgi:hypothetical protein
VHQKIVQIIREEMDAIGGQEMLMPVLNPAELWQRSGRYGPIARAVPARGPSRGAARDGDDARGSRDDARGPGRALLSATCR